MRDELLSAGEVARRLGIAVTTLRTWHQRYDLGPSHHEAGRHRRYTPEDFARLDTMRRLTAQGVPAATAARIALDGSASDVPGRSAAAVGRDGGGHSIPVGRAGTAPRGLARAAMRLDQSAMRAALDEAIAAHGVVFTWDSLICPVLRGIGERHARTRAMVDVEHLLSRTVSEALTAVRPPDGNPAILLACTDEEQHSLPLEALAAALSESGRPSRLLGARVPPKALLTAVRRTGPSGIVLWSHTPPTADPRQLEPLLDHRPVPIVIVAAGPGWHAADLPPAVHTPHTLTEALDLVRGLGHRLEG
ncbi:MAG TPA: MerR family transcriptional regulator [Actinophytocola sp.]|jgi:DNA-binding transcriptional MerR regulator|uniref:MerR family transcriptional regulator n=1 Tax=Actinophytocola sp. TaxID=1872138 RepID=UPI002F947592